MNEIKNMNDIEQLWYVLSDLFVDNEVDYQYIAIEVSAYSLATIEFHLFYNVAPVCSANLEHVIPPIWASFDKAELIHAIYAQGIQSASQITLKRKLAAKLYKIKYRTEWESLNVFLNNESI